MHAISKIIARHADRKGVEVGEIVNVVPDYVMLNDRGAARAADLLRQMGGDKVWFGSTASSWEGDLNGYSSNLSSSIAAAVAVVAQALASTPATCTPAEAKMENLFLEGY